MTATMAGERYVENKLKHDVRVSNMTAAKKLADAIRTSLGPRGMDKIPREGYIKCLEKAKQYFLRIEEYETCDLIKQMNKQL